MIVDELGRTVGAVADEFGSRRIRLPLTEFGRFFTGILTADPINMAPTFTTEISMTPSYGQGE